mmetsp:Transcript_122732/g.392264  ORF Transcript_122732/g.392264 Transcript_122732/m.392264 type:complete len:247 (+) Transcript_122732:543-1283(+)
MHQVPTDGEVRKDEEGLNKSSVPCCLTRWDLSLSFHTGRGKHQAPTEGKNRKARLLASASKSNVRGKELGGLITSNFTEGSCRGVWFGDKPMSGLRARLGILLSCGSCAGDSDSTPSGLRPSYKPLYLLISLCVGTIVGPITNLGLGAWLGAPEERPPKLDGAPAGASGGPTTGGETISTRKQCSMASWSASSSQAWISNLGLGDALGSFVRAPRLSGSSDGDLLGPVREKDCTRSLAIPASGTND